MNLRKHIIAIMIIAINGVLGMGLIVLYARIFDVSVGEMPLHIGVHVLCLALFLWIIWNVDSGYQADVTAQAGEIPLPTYIMNPLAELQSLGFVYLALAKTFDHFYPQQYELLYTNDDHSILATIQPMDAENRTYEIELISVFPDEAFVITTYPEGTVTNTSHLRRVGIKNSIPDAYHFHLRQMGDFTQQFGEPITLDSYERIQQAVDRSLNKRLQNIFTRDFALIVILFLFVTVIVLSIVSLLLTNFYLDNFSEHLLLVVMIGLSSFGLYKMPNLDGKDIRQIKKKETS